VLAGLWSRRGEMKNKQAREELLGYLEARWPSLPDDAARWAARLALATLEAAHWRTDDRASGTQTPGLTENAHERQAAAQRRETARKMRPRSPLA
jgi:hypothetical protein